MVHEILGNADSNSVLSKPAYSRFREAAVALKNLSGGYEGREAELAGQLFQELTYDFLREYYRGSTIITEGELSTSLKEIARGNRYGVISADRTSFRVKDYRSWHPQNQNIGLPDAMVVDNNNGLFEIKHFVEAKLRTVKPFEERIKNISQQAKNFINFLRTERGEGVFFDVIGSEGTLKKPDYSREIFLRVCPLQEIPKALNEGVKFQTIPYKRADILEAVEIFLSTSSSHDTPAK